MRVFNREVIEEFTASASEEVSTFALNWLEQTLTEVIEDIRKKTPVVSDKYELILVNDFMTGATTINSDIDLFVAFKSPQLELNSKKIVDNKTKQFLNKIKKAWLISREEKKNKRKRKKRKEKQVTSEEVIIPPNKYSIINLKESVLNGLVNKLDADSYIYVNSKGLKLISRDFLGIDVNIYLVLQSFDSYKIYDDIKGEFTEVDFAKFEENFGKKLETVGENFVYTIRIFKNIYYNLFSRHTNILFMESLVYNCPDSLFEGYDFFEVFIKVLNYIKNASIENFVLITDDSKKLFSNNLFGESMVNIKNMIKEIDKNL